MDFRFALLAGLLAFSYAKPTAELAKPLNNRILDGQEAAPGEFPHQVSLHIQYQGVGRHICGGSIINNYWILTAACGSIDPKYVYYVLAGKHDLAKHESTEQAILVEKIFSHTSSSSKYRQPYDIGLYKLSRPLIFDKYVQPIALPEKYNSNVLGDVVLSGWGHYNANNNILQKAYLSIIDMETCKKLIEESVEYEIGVTNNFCTGPNDTGLCSGEIGNPVIKINKNNITELVGIASWGTLPCGGYGGPTIFTNVSFYINWINATIADN